MTALPAGIGLALDPSVRTRNGGLLLIGGSPVRVMRLTAAGRAAVDALLSGAEPGAAGRRLGRRLVDAGLAHPRPRPSEDPPSVTVVIPVRDRLAELETCLTAVAGGAPVLIVDDGSARPAAVAELGARHGATVLRRERAGGPAAARNTGLAEVGTDLVAFLDSDCVAPAGWLEALSPHFADPLVAAVAPRVLPSDAPTRRGALPHYARHRSPLDMGPRESAVAPGGRVSYVPTAALVVRRTALASGFDDALRYGEDVDLVWRLHDQGLRVRYDPAVVVRHREPRSWRALLRRRYRYGTSAGALARRHPGRLAPLVVHPLPGVAAACLVATRWRPAAVLAAAHGAHLAVRTRRAGIPPAQALAWSGRAVGHALAGYGRAATTLAVPALLAGLASRRTRTTALVLLCAAPLEEWTRRRPALDPVRWTLACVADDAAYGFGVWRSSLREGTARPLLPRVATGR